MTSITAQVENLLNFLTYYGSTVFGAFSDSVESVPHGVAGMGKLLCEIRTFLRGRLDFSRPRFHL